MIIHYIAEENVFIVIVTVYIAFITDGILKRHIKACFKLMVNKQLRCLRKANMLNSKLKIKSPSMIYAFIDNLFWKYSSA